MRTTGRVTTSVHGGPMVGVEVRVADGRAIGKVPSTRVTPDSDGRVVRLVGITLEGIPEGSDVLAIQVRDEAGGTRLEHHEPFVHAAKGPS